MQTRPAFPPECIVSGPYLLSVCVFFCVGRRVGEVAACVPQPALLPALHQPLPGRGLGQLFLHHAGHRG